MILVTGATGFVGTQLVSELCRQGKRVRCLVRRGSNLEKLRSPGVEFAYGDVTQPDTLSTSLQGIKTVIHLAAIIAEKGKATFGWVNREGTQSLIEVARQAGVERFLYMSNVGAGPNPGFPFLYSKWQAEESVKSSRLDYTIFRASIIFGPGDKFINTLAGLIRTLPLLPVIGSGRTRFQPVSVGDVAHCIVLSLEDEKTVGQILYLAGPEHLSYEDILNTIMAVMGKRRLKVHIPVSLMRPLVWTMGKVLPDPPITTQQLAMLNRDNIVDLDAVGKTFNFKPIPLSQAIDYVKSNRQSATRL